MLKSSWSDASLDDHNRPLNKRGRRDAPRIAQELHNREWIPDRIRELFKEDYGDT